MISADSVLMLIRSVLDGEGEVRWIDRPLAEHGGNSTFTVLDGLFNRWRFTWHNAKPYGFVAMVESDVNQIGGFDDWHEVECENPVDELTEIEYERFVGILAEARQFTGYTT